MKTLTMGCIVSMICCAPFSSAEPARAATSNVPGQAYPVIDDDRRATFRVQAPNAQTVQISVGKTYDLVQDAEGFWTVTTDPLVVVMEDGGIAGGFGQGRRGEAGGDRFAVVREFTDVLLRDVILIWR